jgi:hypothetical protein
MQYRPVGFLIGVALGVACLSPLAGQADRPKFFPDDPIWIDDDRAFDAARAAPIEDSDILDFARNTFFRPGDRRDVRAVNVNTLDEVPDSSWFVNRLGRRALTLAEIVRGPDRFDSIDVQDWPITAGKGEGIQPGYRVTDPQGHIWQVEFDPPSHPEMASGAEIIGTAFYHAFGYHVVDVYLAEIDPTRIRIAPKATLRDPGTGRRRPFTRRDLAAVLARAARRANGRVRAIVSRFAEGRPIGTFRYFGTRPDDPNDIHPHEHRRELRGSRVFASWLNHDDSRGLNSLDMLQERDGRRTVTHYMFDFGSIMGSGTVRAQAPRAGNEYILEWKPGLLTGLALGLYFKPWVLIDYPDVPPSVGRFEGDWFKPAAWKPEYPNPAFDNMRPDDAFWAARILARVDAEAIRPVVEKARYSDPRATDHITRVLVKRRDKVLREWLNAVTPLVDPVIQDGVLTMQNAAVAQGVATPPERYVARWFTLDNASGVTSPLGEPMEIEPAAADAAGDGRFRVSTEVPQSSPSDYLCVVVEGIHREHAAWAANPATFFFRRTAAGWVHVGTERGK